MGPMQGRNRGVDLQGRGREHCRHPSGKSSMYKGKNISKGMVGNGLNDRRGKKAEFWGQRTWMSKEEEVGEKVSGVWRLHGGTRNGFSGGFEPDPSRENAQT